MNEPIYTRQLALKKAQLPSTLPELRDYILLSREKVQAYKVVLRSLDRQGAKEVYDQTLAEAQIMGEHVLYAEATLGDVLADLSGSHSGTTKVLPDGINKKASHRAQQLARNPDIIEKVVEKAIAKGIIPTRDRSGAQGD